MQVCICIRQPIADNDGTSLVSRERSHEKSSGTETKPVPSRPPCSKHTSTREATSGPLGGHGAGRLGGAASHKGNHPCHYPVQAQARLDWYRLRRRTCSLPAKDAQRHDDSGTFQADCSGRDKNFFRAVSRLFARKPPRLRPSDLSQCRAPYVPGMATRKVLSGDSFAIRQRSRIPRRKRSGSMVIRDRHKVAALCPGLGTLASLCLSDPAHVHGKRSQNESQNLSVVVSKLSPSSRDPCALLAHILLSCVHAVGRFVVPTSETHAAAAVASFRPGAISPTANQRSARARCSVLTTPDALPHPIVFAPLCRSPNAAVAVRSRARGRPLEDWGTEERSAPGPAPCAAPHVPAISVSMRTAKVCASPGHVAARDQGEVVLLSMKPVGLSGASGVANLLATR